VLAKWLQPALSRGQEASQRLAKRRQKVIGGEVSSGAETHVRLDVCSFHVAMLGMVSRKVLLGIT